MKIFDLFDDDLNDSGKRLWERRRVQEARKKSLKNPKDNPCWSGYHPVGTKQKDGRTVPNCVPKNEGVTEGRLDEGKGSDVAKALVSTFNATVGGDRFGPLEVTGPGTRVWTRGDGTRHRDPGKIKYENDEAIKKWPGAIQKFWQWLSTQSGVKSIGQVSGEFGSSPMQDAVTYKGLYFALKQNSIAWGSASRVKNPRSVWRQKSPEAGVAEGLGNPLQDIGQNAWHLIQGDNPIAINFPDEARARSFHSGHGYGKETKVLHSSQVRRNAYLKHNPGVINWPEYSKGMSEADSPTTYVIIYKDEQNQTKQKKVQSSSATRAQAKFEKAYPNYRVVGLKDWEQGVAEAEKNPFNNPLGKALYRDLSKEKKASPVQVQRNKERWAKRQAEKAQGVAEAERNEMDTPEFQAALAKLKQRAQQGPMKTVYDPVTRKYKVVPVSQMNGMKEGDQWSDGKGQWTGDDDQWSTKPDQWTDESIEAEMEAVLESMRRDGYQL